MNEYEFFLKAICKVNNNEVLNKVNVKDVVFIDHTQLKETIVDGIKVDNCVRLKMLPSSGVVGSRKIYYTKLDIGILYQSANNIVIYVNNNADIEELLHEVHNQIGIVIEPAFITNSLSTKLVFDSQNCGSIELYANPKSIFVIGKITINYTSNKYRILNYVPNRVIVFSENELASISSRPILVRPESYYFDLSLFPPDHDLYKKYDMLNSPNSKTGHNDNSNGVITTSAERTRFNEGSLPTYFEHIRTNGISGTSIEKAWDDDVRYNLKRIILGYLQYTTTYQTFLRRDGAKGWGDRPGDIPYNVHSTRDGNCSICLSEYKYYFIGTVPNLLNHIKNDSNVDSTSGNCGLNMNYKYVFAIYGRSIDYFYDIIPFYWGVS